MPTFPPTAEQTAIVNAVQTGQNVVVKAAAGSGKTSTLVLCAEALSGKNIAYVAFNKDIANDAGGKMPSNVEARTASSFAYRGTIIFPQSQWGKRFQNRQSSGYEYARALGINTPMTFAGDDDSHTLKISTLGYIVRQTVEFFCQSDAPAITAYNVPRQDGLNKAGQGALATFILPYAERVWADLNNPNGKLVNYTFCHYLKQFQLSGQPIKVKLNGNKAVPAEVIMFDEAQDAAPVIRAIVQQQKVQTIVVGDENQAIYGFTGAVNALDAFNAKHVLKLTKSFRFGPAIAEVANKLLAQLDTDMRVEGHEPVPSVVNIYGEEG